MSYVLLDNVFQKIDYFDPNVLIDIYIKFVIISSIFYILYKYYLIDITVNNIFELLQKKLNIYLPSFKNIKQNNSTVFTLIDKFLNDYINTLNDKPSTANSTINDTNMIIIFVTLIVSLFVILCMIIFISNGYKYIDFKNVGYSLLFNIIFISLSQFIVFYVLYKYIDPLQIYNIFFYNYVINPIAPEITLPEITLPEITLPSEITLPEITLPLEITLPSEITLPNKIKLGSSNTSTTVSNATSANATASTTKASSVTTKASSVTNKASAITKASTTDKLNSLKNKAVSLVAPKYSIPNLNSLGPQSTPQPVIINSTYTGTLFIFINIFIFIFIIMFILTILNYLVVYNNYNVGNRIIPFTRLSLVVYIILTFVSLSSFIILLLLLMNIL